VEGISFTKPATGGLVSIVIPTYQGERLIGETLASISKQSYRRWEVIVVEDGSNNRTEAVVKSFARRHPWHRVHYSQNEQNRGPSYTRNAAFAKVRGEMVALLDSDDRWLPDHLSVSVEALQTSGKDVVYSTVLMIEDQTELLLGLWGPQAGELVNFPQSLFGRNFITPSATVLRRQVLADIGLWDTNLRYCEDLDFWLRCLASGKTFQYVGGCHCLYRRNHAEAATGRMCQVLESFAQVVERHMHFPGLRERTCCKYVAQAYVAAAQRHATSDPCHDPSADHSRASRLMLKAWRLKPNRVRYLWPVTKFGVADFFRRRKRPVAIPAPDAAPALTLTDSPAKLAA
jgi:cellulose synthase/poly-beta-1,6-N-acetylglucosamine synthase-like glycosyltransferase